MTSNVIQKVSYVPISNTGFNDFSDSWNTYKFSDDDDIGRYNTDDGDDDIATDDENDDHWW